MDKERVVEILREHEAELKAGGLMHLRLFGSVARGEDNADSDVDLLFDYDESEGRHLLVAYDCEQRVSELLGTKAHLSSARHIRREFRPDADEAVVHVY